MTAMAVCFATANRALESSTPGRPRLRGGGFQVDVGTAGSIARRGYYPAGGGEVRLALQPVTRLMPFVVQERGRARRAGRTAGAGCGAIVAA